MKHLISGLLALSVGANVWLGRETYRLRNTVVELTARPVLKPGDHLPEFVLRDASGHVRTVRFGESGKPTVLYVTSSACGWCARNLPAITSLAEQAAPRFRFVAIALGDLPAADFQKYIDSQHLPFEMLTGLSDTGARSLRVRGTPTTIVVASNGNVDAMWESAFADDAKRTAESFFGVKLAEILAPLEVPGALAR